MDTWRRIRHAVTLLLVLGHGLVWRPTVLGQEEDEFGGFGDDQTSVEVVSAPTPRPPPHVTIKADQMTLWALLDEIVRQSESDYYLPQQSSILITDPAIVLHWFFRANFVLGDGLHTLFSGIVTDCADSEQNARLKGFLDSCGFNFPAGAQICYIPHLRPLISANTRFNTQDLTGLLTTLGEAQREQASAEKDASQVTPPYKLLGRLHQVLALTVPRVDLENVTLAEAVEFFRRSAKDLDPEKQGIPVQLLRQCDAPGKKEN